VPYYLLIVAVLFQGLSGVGGGVALLADPTGLWRRRPWAWHGSVFVGASLVVWIAVQVAMVGYRGDPPLQAIYGGLGVAILALCLGRSR
jgi:hypothetical protein